MIRRLLSFLAVPLCAFAQLTAPSTNQPEAKPPVMVPEIVGRWDSQLLSAEGKADPVPFVIAIQVQGRDLRADLLNGPSRIAFSKVTWKSGELRLELAQYDGAISAKCVDKSCDTLAGDYSRTTRAGKRTFRFQAQRHPVELQHKPLAWTWPTLEGQWTFTFDPAESEADRVAPARFTASAAEVNGRGGAVADVNGTIAPVSGDFGLMHGTEWVDKTSDKVTRFSLSRFDGIHVLLMQGQFLADGSITGSLQFSFTKPQNFTAVRSEPEPSRIGTPEIPNPESVSSVKNPAEPFRFTATDLATGQKVTQDDPRFKGKPLIIDIFGTWCPNCHDEAPLLSDLYNRFHAKGLEIVGLSFEYTPDQARSKRLIDVYRNTYNIGFPLLLAGTTDEGQVQSVMPQLQNFGAYPTTIFIDRTGHVKAIHAGFAGPATGNYAEVQARFEQLVSEMLK